MNEFHFLRPYWLPALLAVAALVVWMLRSRRSSRNWASVCDPQLLPFVLIGDRESGQRTLLPWLIGVGATLLVIALAGPTWEKLPQPVFRDQSALVIALDLSRSMDTEDLKPSRAERALHTITDIFRTRQAGQTALLVYAGEAFTVSPLTDDQDTILAQLPSLDTSLMPVQGSRPDLAVEAAGALLQQAGIARGHVLLVTDGVENDALTEALDKLRKQGHRLSILGVGTREGAPIPVPGGGFLKDRDGTIVVPRLDSASLQQWAQKGGGRYAEIRADDRDIRYLLDAQLDAGIDQAEQAIGLDTDQWREQGPWLILLVIPLAALAFRRGVWVLALAVLMPLPEPAQALDWSDLWRTPDQQGMQAFEQGDAQAAAKQFENPQWKAAAQYRAGQFAEAADTLKDIDTPDALYNRGNALAQQGDIAEAMASYERALELAPQHEDARYNLDLLQQQQQQQQQQDSKSAQQNPSDSSDSDNASDSGQTDQASESRAAQGKNQNSEASAAENRAKLDDEQPEQQQEAQQSTKDQSATETDPESKHMASAQEHQDDEASESATEQWLRRIPDDPGGLLRRKFRYQYQQRGRQMQSEDQPW